jgi:hypothetical protein
VLAHSVKVVRGHFAEGLGINQPFRRALPALEASLRAACDDLDGWKAAGKLLERYFRCAHFVPDTEIEPFVFFRDAERRNDCARPAPQEADFNRVLDELNLPLEQRAALQRWQETGRVIDFAE